MASTLLSVAEVREHLETGLSDAALGRLVDSQDERIRAFVGEHDGTITWEGESRNLSIVWLPRPAESITSVEERYYFESTWAAVAATEYYLSNGGRSVRRYAFGFQSYVRVIYEPVPENAQRTQALIDLVRLRTLDNGLAAESDDTYKTTSVDYSEAERRILEPLRHRYAGAGLMA